MMPQQSDNEIPHFSRHDLEQRGWTKSMIEKLLGSHDSIRRATGWGSSDVQVWESGRVIKTEASIEFATALTKSLSRRGASESMIRRFEENRELGPLDFEHKAKMRGITSLFENMNYRASRTLDEALDEDLRLSITDWRIQNYYLPKFASLIISGEILKEAKDPVCRPATMEERNLFGLHEMLLKREFLLYADWNGAFVMSSRTNENKTSLETKNGKYFVQFGKYPNVVFAQKGQAFPNRTTLAGRFDMQFLTTAEYGTKKAKPLSDREIKSLMTDPDFSRLSKLWSNAWHPGMLSGVYWKLVNGTLLLESLQANDEIHDLFFKKIRNSVKYLATGKKAPFYQQLWAELFA